MIDRDFDVFIRKAMADARITGRQLAERTGLHRSTISQYEHGKRTPSWPTLLRILDALGYEIDRKQKE